MVLSTWKAADSFCLHLINWKHLAQWKMALNTARILYIQSYIASETHSHANAHAGIHAHSLRWLQRYHIHKLMQKYLHCPCKHIMLNRPFLQDHTVYLLVCVSVTGCFSSVKVHLLVTANACVHTWVCLCTYICIHMYAVWVNNNRVIRCSSAD